MFSEICQDYYRQILEQRLEKARALVISTTVCPACTKAKNILDRNKVEYKEIQLDLLDDKDGNEVANCVYGRTPRRYVPFIFLDKQRLGGYQELYQLHQSGQLKAQE